MWSALVVTVDALVCVYEWVWVGVCFCHSFSVSFYSFFCSICSLCSFFTSITNHLEDLTWINFYDSNGVQLWSNKALKLSYLTFNRNISAGASSTITIKNDYSTTDEKILYCPPTCTFCPTTKKDVYLSVNYIGGIKLLNYGSSFTNQNIQGMMVFKAKG